MPLTGKIHLFKAKETEVFVDLTALLLLPLLVLTVRYRLVSYYFLHLDSAYLWYATIAISIAIVLCVLAHEGFHLMVSRSRGHHSKGLFLGIFGAEDPIENAPRFQNERLVIIFSGLLFSGLLGLSLLGASWFFDMATHAILLSQILFHLALLNFALIALQALPVLPLDGGRFALEFFLRRGVVHSRGVKILFGIGNVIGLAMICLGGYLHRELPFLAAWLIVIGLSLLKANWAEYRVISKFFASP